ncbi:MAG: hypothetical protein AAGA30_13035, partial [Planctomycetota bacterium]
MMWRRYLLCSFLVLASVGCGGNTDTSDEEAVSFSLDKANPAEETNKLVADLIQAEDLVLDLTFRLKAIGSWWESDEVSDSVDQAPPLPKDLRTIRRCQRLTPVNLTSE